MEVQEMLLIVKKLIEQTDCFFVELSAKAQGLKCHFIVLLPHYFIKP